MIFANFAELSSVQDLDYLKSSLNPSLNDEEARKMFTKLIFESLNTKSTQLNFAVHNLAHPGIF